MDSSMNKSISDTDINLAGSCKSPPCFVFQRAKRSREDVSIGLQLDEFKEEMRKMMKLFTEKRESETHEINLTLKQIQQSNINIEKSITSLTEHNEELKVKIGKLESQAKESNQYITVLEQKLEDIQIGCRKANFVLKNVPKKSDESKEDLMDMVVCLSRNIGCVMDKHNINDIFRVRGKKSDSPNTPIVVETSSAILKAELLKMGKTFNLKNKTKLSCKHLGLKTHEDTPIFLAEHLTTKASRLFFHARDLSKSGAYKFCWTAYGKVYVKKNEHSPTVIIRTEDQVHQLILKT